MKSRISIEVDFENSNQPVIQIISNDSEDVRDKLIKSFLEGLGHKSRWCRIEYKGQRSNPNPLDYSNNSVYHISVIGTDKIPEEADLMNAMVKTLFKNETPV